MTLVFLLAAERTRKMRALPPARLTADLTPPLERAVSSSRRADLTMLGHFGYATCAGSFYAWIMGRFSPKSAAVETSAGLLFGAAVWLASYPGWIELSGSRARASKLTREENLWMFAAHLVWGASLGFAEGGLRRLGKSSLDGLS